jgi:rhodanese-related sulfurtransferase
MDHSPRFLKLVTEAKTHVRELTVDDVRAKQERGESFELIDTREDSEWSQGHIKGARHLGRGVLERDIEKAIPDPGREIVLYCGGGFRCALAAESLRKMGYTNVASMDGGWRTWTERKLPVE